MIQAFVQRWDARKSEVVAQFTAAHPASYKELVQSVVGILQADGFDSSPDPERVHEIDDGHYQGTLLYVIASTGYQPSTYWSVAVNYGSCSVCDTLQDIRGYSDDPPTEQQVAKYMSLTLHVVQGLRLITG